MLEVLIAEYAQKMSSENSELLRNVESSTALNTYGLNMISGFFQGRLLSLMARLKQPRGILEIGTYSAYSSLCLSEGLSKGSRIISIEKDKSLRPLIEYNISQSTYKDQITIKYGHALDILYSLELDKIDLVFIDAAKKEYKEYYHILVENLPKNALMIFDNVLWKGEVINEEKSSIAATLAELNRDIKNDPRVSNFILPFRDGLNFVIKLT